MMDKSKKTALVIALGSLSPHKGSGMRGKEQSMKDDVAGDEVELMCPRCGHSGPESEFETTIPAEKSPKSGSAVDEGEY